MTKPAFLQDVGAVVECIKAELGSAQAQASEVPAPPLPSIPWHEHTDIHCCTFVDREAQQPKASISFKCSSAPNNTAAQMLRQLAVRRPSRPCVHQRAVTGRAAPRWTYARVNTRAHTWLQVEMLHNVLNRRLDEVCRREEGPFYGALMGCEPLTRRCEAHCLDVVAYERRICEGVEAALTEIARLRMHGIPDVRPRCTGRVCVRSAGKTVPAAGPQCMMFMSFCCLQGRRAQNAMPVGGANTPVACSASWIWQGLMF